MADECKSGPEASELAPFGNPKAAAAVREAMLAHDRRLRRYLAQLIGFDAAEDAVQELYARLLHVARDGSRDSFTFAYLRRVAESVAFDLLRRQKSRRVRQSVELDPETPAAAPDPYDYTRERQRLAHLKEAILELPPLQRRVLLMHRFDDMSLADIASELRLPLRTVQRHMMRALANCRLQLEQRGWS